MIDQWLVLAHELQLLLVGLLLLERGPARRELSELLDDLGRDLEKRRLEVRDLRVHVKHDILVGAVLSDLVEGHAVLRQVQGLQGLLLLALELVQEAVGAILVRVLGRCLGQTAARLLAARLGVRRLHVQGVLGRRLGPLEEQELVEQLHVHVDLVCQFFQLLVLEGVVSRPNIVFQRISLAFVFYLLIWPAFRCAWVKRSVLLVWLGHLLLEGWWCHMVRVAII